MAVIKSTAANYQVLMDELFRAATRLSVQTMAVNAGGMGYTVGDSLNISGGTSTVAAQARVLTAPGGVVGTVAVLNSGVYTVAPATTAAATTGGTGTGCTLNTTNSSNGWTAQRASAVDGTAQSATVGSGGSGYAVNDTLTITGGTVYQAATFKVLTAPGGIVGTVSLLSPGSYVTPPSNAASTSGGAGTGCTLNVTYGTAGSGTERELILKGTGLGGTDSIFAGARSYNDAGSGATNWELAGFTGFDPNLTWDNEPGISPGRYTTVADNGAYVPLSGTSMTYWLFINGRRIHGVVKIGSANLSFSFGFGNPYATTGEYPYPLFICGCTNQRLALPSSSVVSLASIANPQNHGSQNGCGLIRYTDGQWYSVHNATGSTGRIASTSGFQMWPCGTVPTNQATGADAWFNSSVPFAWSGVVPQAGNPGTQTTTIQRIQDTSPLPPLFPCTIITNSPSLGDVMEVDNLFWFDARGGIVSEDTLTIGSQRYIVFHSGNQTDGWMHFCIKEQ